MNNYIGQLQSLLRFYDKNLGSRGGTGGSNAYHSSVGVGGGGEIRPGLLWAQDQMARMGQQGEQSQNFFADASPAYVHPQGFDGQMPEFQMRQGPMRQPVNNFLSRFLGARRG